MLERSVKNDTKCVMVKRGWAKAWNICIFCCNSWRAPVEGMGRKRYSILMRLVWLRLKAYVRLQPFGGTQFPGAYRSIVQTFELSTHLILSWMVKFNRSLTQAIAFHNRIFKAYNYGVSNMFHLTKCIHSSPDIASTTQSNYHRTSLVISPTIGRKNWVSTWDCSRSLHLQLNTTHFFTSSL